jgi:hypothetical protein
MCLQKETEETRKSLLAFFFRWLWRCSDYFAFCSAFRNDAQFGCRHICATSKGKVAFTALPNPDAFASYLDEATLGAFMRSFESSDNFNVSLANCCSVPSPQTPSRADFFCSWHYLHHLSFLRSSAAFSLASFEASIISCGVK